MLRSHLRGGLDHVIHEPSHPVAVNFPMEFVVEDLHLGQTREGGGQQVTLLGVLPAEQIHNFVVQWCPEAIKAACRHCGRRMTLESSEPTLAYPHLNKTLKYGMWPCGIE